MFADEVPRQAVPLQCAAGSAAMLENGVSPALRRTPNRPRAGVAEVRRQSPPATQVRGLHPPSTFVRSPTYLTTEDANYCPKFTITLPLERPINPNQPRLDCINVIIHML